jgi:hypothetical protein
VIGSDFISRRVGTLLEQFSRAGGHPKPPVDPANLAQFCGVVSVEPRPMVPEGVLVPVEGGFKIYFQSNFESQRGTRLRQRFTIAHEIVHTFYYDYNEGVPKPTRGAPAGVRLERLCHIGASQILMPDSLVGAVVQERGEPDSAGYIVDLAGTFEVSPEVAMRRLHDLRLIPEDRFAAVLVDAADGIIRAACYGSPLLCHTLLPKQGLNFDDWARPLLDPSRRSEESEWTCRNRSGVIAAKKVYTSDRSFILELRFGRSMQDTTTKSGLWDSFG